MPFVVVYVPRARASGELLLQNLLWALLPTAVFGGDTRDHVAGFRRETGSACVHTKQTRNTLEDRLEALHLRSPQAIYVSYFFSIDTIDTR